MSLRYACSGKCQVWLHSPASRVHGHIILPHAARTLYPRDLKLCTQPTQQIVHVCVCEGKAYKVNSPFSLFLGLTLAYS